MTVDVSPSFFKPPLWSCWTAILRTSVQCPCKIKLLQRWQGQVLSRRMWGPTVQPSIRCTTPESKVSAWHNWIKSILRKIVSLIWQRNPNPVLITVNHICCCMSDVRPLYFGFFISSGSNSFACIKNHRYLSTEPEDAMAESASSSVGGLQTPGQAHFF